MTQAERQKQYANLINLGLHPDEVAEVLADDERIDRGEKLFDLPKELEVGAKKARQAGNCKGYTKTPKEKKVDNDKKFIMETLELALTGFVDNEKIVNPEREMTFKYKDRKFKIVLSCPRN